MTGENSSASGKRVASLICKINPQAPQGRTAADLRCLNLMGWCQIHRIGIEKVRPLSSRLTERKSPREWCREEWQSKNRGANRQSPSARVKAPQAPEMSGP